LTPYSITDLKLILMILINRENNVYTFSMIFDLVFSGDADFLDEVGRLFAADVFPEERPEPVLEVAERER